MSGSAERVLYIIQVHRETQLREQLELLFRDEDSYLISVDPTVALDEAPLITLFAERRCTRYWIRKSLPVAWGGSSQVLAWLDVLRFAMRDAWDWTVVVNLSGDCLPLAPPQRIAEVLAGIHASGATVALGQYERMPWTYNRAEFERRCFPRIPFSSPLWWTSLVPHHLAGRVDALVQPEVLTMLGDPSRSPLLKWVLRVGLHCTDMTPAKQLVLRALFPEEITAGHAFFAEVELAGGRAWFALWRSAVASILEDSELDWVIGAFKHTICADELALPTLIARKRGRGELAVHPRNLHFAQGAPIQVTDAMCAEILESDALFVRKVDHAQCPALLAAVRARTR